jgi:putative pyruvate formate lyase activating enzyme
MTPSLGEPLTSHFFQDALEWGRRQGARNIQWVGGEPSIHLNSILTLMRNTPNLPPVIWKSNLYLNSHAIDQLWEFVNVFVADFKFGNKYCATTLCGADNYFEWVTAALLAIYRRKPEALVVRHLLMPGHFNCCFLPVLDWFTQKIPQAVFSLRDGYIPAWQAKNDPVLGVRIDPNDVRRAEKIVYERCLHVT